MRLYLALCGLAVFAGSAHAQQPTAPAPTTPDTTSRGDTSRVLRSSVTALDTAGLVNQLSGHAAAREAFTGLLASDTVAADTLRVTRDQAVAMALANNPQIVVAREQVAEAKAASVQLYAVPDPSASALIIN